MAFEFPDERSYAVNFQGVLCGVVHGPGLLIVPAIMNKRWVAFNCLCGATILCLCVRNVADDVFSVGWSAVR